MTHRSLPQSTSLGETGIRYHAFVSYRREGGAVAARLIRSELEKRGFSVFLDVEDLTASHFDERLLREIENAPNFIILLSPGSLDQCRQTDDWLLRELSHAINNEKNIIPVILEGFEFPPAAVLPTAIRDIPRYQSIVYSHLYFAAAMDKLVSYLMGAHKDRRETVQNRGTTDEFSVRTKWKDNVEDFVQELKNAPLRTGDIHWILGLLSLGLFNVVYNYRLINQCRNFLSRLAGENIPVAPRSASLDFHGKELTYSGLYWAGALLHGAAWLTLAALTVTLYLNLDASFSRGFTNCLKFALGLLLAGTTIFLSWLWVSAKNLDLFKIGLKKQMSLPACWDISAEDMKEYARSAERIGVYLLFLAGNLSMVYWLSTVFLHNIQTLNMPVKLTIMALLVVILFNLLFSLGQFMAKDIVAKLVDRSAEPMQPKTIDVWFRAILISLGKPGAERSATRDVLRRAAEQCLNFANALNHHWFGSCVATIILFDILSLLLLCTVTT